VKAQQEQWFTAVQRAYLNVAGSSSATVSGGTWAATATRPADVPDAALISGPPSLAARQSAARGSGLLERVARVRPMARSAETRAALDALEVVLTRLDLLDAQAGDAPRPLPTC